MPLSKVLILLLIVGAVLYIINKYAPIDGKFKIMINWVVCIVVIVWLITHSGVAAWLDTFHI